MSVAPNDDLCERSLERISKDVAVSLESIKQLDSGAFPRAQAGVVGFVLDQRFRARLRAHAPHVTDHAKGLGTRGDFLVEERAKVFGLRPRASVVFRLNQMPGVDVGLKRQP